MERAGLTDVWCVVFVPPCHLSRVPQIEYMDSSARAARREAAEAAAAASAFRERAAAVRGEEARALLHEYVGQAVAARLRERQEQAKVAQLEAQLVERERALSDAQGSLQLKEMDYDRRVIELQKEHAKKVQMILAQVRLAGRLEIVSIRSNRTRDDLFDLGSLSVV